MAARISARCLSFVVIVISRGCSSPRCGSFARGGVGLWSRSSARGSRTANLLQQLFDAILVRDRLVEHERQFGCVPEPQPLADLAPHERRGALERFAAVRTRLGIAHRRIKDAR